MSGALTVSRLLPLLLLLVILICARHGRSEDGEGHAYARRSTSRGTHDDWTLTTTYETRGYADRPDARILEAVTVVWQEPEVDGLGNLCILQGRLEVPGLVKKQREPIHWFQGLTVYLAMAPEAKLDWSDGSSPANSLSKTAIVNNRGEFQVRLDLRNSQRDRTQAQSFQVGLALASHTSDGDAQSVEWSSRTPTISASVRMLMVLAAPEVSPELELVSRAGGWPFRNPNGVDLIRAANALQRLGKERALEILEKYLELTRAPEYYGEYEVVFWIIRVLFEPIRPDERVPIPAIAVFLDNSSNARQWPLNPMEVVDDVPFMVGHPMNLVGLAEHPSSHVLWALRHGVLREEPLTPTTNPLAAAGAILRSRRFKSLNKSSRDAGVYWIRAQALAMAKDLVQTVETGENADDQWQARLDEAAEAGIHWDAKREEFVAREK